MQGREKVATEILAELAGIVLKNNIFQFNEKIVKQLRGTAIGIKFTPLYAVLFIAYLEKRILENIELQLAFDGDILMI